MKVNRVSPMVNFSKKEEVKSTKIGKIEVANAGKKVLTGLSCLASFGYYLVASQLAGKKQEEIEKPTDASCKPDGSDKPESPSLDNIDGNIGSKKVDGSSKKDDDDDDGDDGINPGYDGKTKVLLALTTNGRCVEIYELSDGRLISPADYHFPSGRSLDELAYDPKKSDGCGYSISSINTSYSKPVKIEFAAMDDAPNSIAEEMVYKMKVTEALGTLEGAEEILEELSLPRNEDVYNLLYTTSDISSSLYDDIVNGNKSNFSILDLCRRKLKYYLNREDYVIYCREQTPLSQKIISKIDEKIQQIAKEKGIVNVNNSTSQEPDVSEEEQNLYSWDTVQESYEEEPCEEDHVFA